MKQQYMKPYNITINTIPCNEDQPTVILKLHVMGIIKNIVGLCQDSSLSDIV